MRYPCIGMKQGGLAFLLSYAVLTGIPAAGTPGIGIKETYVLHKAQFPQSLKRNNPSAIYIIYSGPLIKKTWSDAFLRKDTIVNLKGLLDSSRAGISYRLLFESRGEVDSVWQTDSKYHITDKAFPAGKGWLQIYAYDMNGRIADQFIYAYDRKYHDENKLPPLPADLFRLHNIYSRTDRNKYAVGAAWVLSIGIDKNKGKGRMYTLLTCESDAKACSQFFQSQFVSLSEQVQGFPDLVDTAARAAKRKALNLLYHDYLLTGEKATKANILNTLKEIAAGASPNDYFVFNFNGMSTLISFDSVNYSTFFIPYDTAGYPEEFFQMITPERKEEVNSRVISLKVLQEHIQLISARNQLFISEAGPSEKFKTEFIKTMMQNSPEIASLLNINRVILVPNKIGLDGFTCQEQKITMAPINYCLTSLNSTYNIYELFSDGYVSSKVASALKATAYNCDFTKEEYFDVFFERKFLQQYKEIFGEESNKTRGSVLTNKEVQHAAGVTGKRHALVIGTDHYKGKGWDDLKNPVYDATEVADILKGYYDYEVQLLKDPPMDSIYKAIRDYYRTLQKDDQFIIYIAGHGDYDKDLLDDGFIVCSDSRSVEDDPLRNSYIQHTKLKKMINKIPAKQILVLLDICHGGVFDEEVRENPASRITNRNLLEQLRENTAYTVRKMLSSVGLEAAFDGKAGKHSPFASYLISVLNARGGLEGYVTLTDIYALLKKASLNETATLKISPHLAGFGDNNPLGEFFLIPADGIKK